MNVPDKKQIQDVLATLDNPVTHTDIVSAGMVQNIRIGTDGRVIVLLEVLPEQGPILESLRQEAERRIAGIQGVENATVILTAEKKPAPPSSSSDPHGLQKAPKLTLPIRHIIAVASGKGGVGKSTVSSALALALAKETALRVGVLDADIYGPSQPKMFGLEAYKPAFTKDKHIIPAQVPAGPHGLKLMSIGFMVDTTAALIWRGPMIQTALYQLFRDVQWGTPEQPLDILIVDLPPGTGDTQLTLAQKIPVTGAIIVSTPQDIALIDARKAIEMFEKTHVPILGLIENMSTHLCSQCGHEEHLFGHGGVRQEAEKRGVPFLGEIPLRLSIREASDSGQPFAFPAEIVKQVLQALIV